MTAPPLTLGTFPSQGLPDQYAPRPRKFSREEYYRLDAEGFFRGQRVERIHGEIVVMSPIGYKHSLAKGMVADLLKDLFGRAYFVREQDPFPVPESDLQPDIAVIAGRRLDYTDHPRRAELIVEVADTSRRYDLGEKSQLYASAGVTDYWVLDLIEQELVVFRNPMPDSNSKHLFSYTSRTVHCGDERVTPLALPDQSVSLSDFLPG